MQIPVNKNPDLSIENSSFSSPKGDINAYKPPDRRHRSLPCMEQSIILSLPKYNT